MAKPRVRLKISLWSSLGLGVRLALEFRGRVCRDKCRVRVRVTVRGERKGGRTEKEGEGGKAGREERRRGRETLGVRKIERGRGGDTSYIH
eukprot:1393010-Amorphochlora_amoeboformis.AAC.1